MKKEITLTKEQYSNLIAIYCFGIMSVTGTPSPEDRLKATMLVGTSMGGLADLYQKVKAIFDDIKDKEGMITISCDKLEVKL